MPIKFDYEKGKHVQTDSKGNVVPFCQKIETMALVIRNLESEELEVPVKVIYYRIQIVYEALDEDTALSWHYFQNEDSAYKFMRVMVTRFTNIPFFYSSQECPIPNALFLEGIEKPLDLKVSKGKAVKITKAEATKLLLEGKTIGLFDTSMQNRYTL